MHLLTLKPPVAQFLPMCVQVLEVTCCGWREGHPQSGSGWLIVKPQQAEEGRYGNLMVPRDWPDRGVQPSLPALSTASLISIFTYPPWLLLTLTAILCLHLVELKEDGSSSSRGDVA